MVNEVKVWWRGGGGAAMRGARAGPWGGARQVARQNTLS